MQKRLHFLNANSQFSDQMKWEYLKCEIRNIAESFFENSCSNYQTGTSKARKRFDITRRESNTLEYIENYNVPKYLWENIYEHITKGIKADVNVMKKVKNLQSFFLISKKHRLEKVLLKC